MPHINKISEAGSLALHSSLLMAEAPKDQLLSANEMAFDALFFARIQAITLAHRSADASVVHAMPKQYLVKKATSCQVVTAYLR